MAYDNPGGLIAATVILQVLVFACLGLRLASRRKLRQRLLVSDWLILAAILFGLGLSIILIFGMSVCHLQCSGRNVSFVPRNLWLANV